MSRIRVSTIIDASPKAVWAAIDDVGSHVDWMADAAAIRFRTEQHAGVGTTFECDTKVGPLALTDIMEITSWKPGREMGVRHVGLVRGSGRFSLAKSKDGGTRFTWQERLTFPWWLGGPLGAVIGGEVLRIVWQRNLHNLKRLIEK
jgi:uncharacterized protein YndB with AHSA1/START domain